MHETKTDSKRLITNPARFRIRCHDGRAHGNAMRRRRVNQALMDLLGRCLAAECGIKDNCRLMADELTRQSRNNVVYNEAGLQCRYATSNFHVRVLSRGILVDDMTFMRRSSRPGGDRKSTVRSHP
jgi:hypothetical protein